MEEKKMVAMTAEEAAMLEEFRKEKEKKAAAERAQQARDAYVELIDDTIELAFPVLMEISKNLSSKKKNILEEFRKAIALKEEVFGVKSRQQSHTFRNSDGTMRITVGHYQRDDYRDTVNEGIAIVQEYIESLAKDDDTKVLVSTILRLLSRDKAGNLKASRVLELRKTAEESGNEKFLEGVKIIEQSYQPSRTTDFIKAEYKNEEGKWVSIPLSMTDC